MQNLGLKLQKVSQICNKIVGLLAKFFLKIENISKTTPNPSFEGRELFTNKKIVKKTVVLTPLLPKEGWEWLNKQFI